ncbi:DUF3558 family protein [Nocardia farcinica]|uniref:DUF3558 domain-containing protein n=1 Tax=Nocardia farcinica (strain IFM 10152) TaxID=247156 RepID=Q5YPX5_NOCFA|nr:DUF3558 family protein [Nocardia farcinica]BAD59766.1 hypothetical protein NFA_49140 [Nocardia farcinica IFM 10152]
MSMKQSWMASVAIIGMACTIASCGESEDNATVRATTTAPIPSYFDPCTDISPEFIAAHNFESPTPFGPGPAIGPTPGKGCYYVRPREYTVSIAVTGAALGSAAEWQKLTYEEIVVAGRPSEIAGPQDGRARGGGTIGNLRCLLHVQIAGGMLTFSYYDWGLTPNPPHPCEAVTTIATEVLGMLPPGS